MSAFTDQVVRVAMEELQTFRDGDLKEYDDDVYRRVGDYWDELAKIPAYASWAGYNGRSGVIFDKHGKVAKNRNDPWSAAFVSYVMRAAGAGSNFRYSPSHSTYIVRALQDAANGQSLSKFKARRHSDHAPRIGDLIACERLPDVNPGYDTYMDYVKQGRFEAHCDVVVGLDADHALTVGGNVSNSVKSRRWPLQGNGRLAEDHTPGDPKGKIICIIANLL